MLQLKLLPRIRTSVGLAIRSQSTTKLEGIRRTETTEEPNPGYARSFEEIPVVKGLPVIGSLLDYTPMRGFKMERIFELWEKRHQEYGNIYRENLMGQDTVYCRSQQDTQAMFKFESRYPRRQHTDGVTFMKHSAGLPESFINLVGEEWRLHRKMINGPLLIYKMVWKYVIEQMKVSEDLTKYILRNMDENGEVPNFASILDRWAFEMSSTFLLNCRMGLLEDNPKEDYMDMFHGLALSMDFVARSFTGFQLWKYMETKETKELKKGVARLYEVMSEIIEEKERDGEFEDTVLGKLMRSEGLTHDQRKSMVFDVFGASVETTSKSSALMIYCLTRNEEAQDKLREEINGLPENELLTGRVMDGMEYMNAFIKEAVRLYPLAHGISRIYDKDIVLSGYHIPAGTSVMNTANSTLNKNPEYFTEPEEFLPERWMGKGGLQKNNLTGPFGMGARACPGRRFAMQEMRLLLIELLRNFKVEYHYRPMISVFRATGYPSEEPRFTFKPLKRE